MTSSERWQIKETRFSAFHLSEGKQFAIIRLAINSCTLWRHFTFPKNSRLHWASCFIISAIAFTSSRVYPASLFRARFPTAILTLSRYNNNDIDSRSLGLRHCFTLSYDHACESTAGERVSRAPIEKKTKESKERRRVARGNGAKSGTGYKGSL